MEKLVCYTVGHSTHKTEEFIRLIKTRSIQYVLDARSNPYSRHNPQYNRELIKEGLENKGVTYLFIGDLLGARYKNPDLYFPGKKIADFRKVRKLDTFQRGIDEISSKLKQGCEIVLMCAEKDPFNCHRFVLISYMLSKMGIVIKHILDDGSIVLNQALEEKLILKYKLNYKQKTFLTNIKNKQEAIEEGYVLRNKDI